MTIRELNAREVALRKQASDLSKRIAPKVVYLIRDCGELELTIEAGLDTFFAGCPIIEAYQNGQRV